MSAAVVKEYLERFGLADRVITFDQSSATVAEAAADLGCEEARIAKTMAFQVGDTPTLVVIAGDGKVDNPRYKAQFHTKAVMISPDELVDKVGHPMGGVCPFAVKEGVAVYLDESLKRFDIVYPAAGNAASAVRLTIEELQTAADHFAGWVNIAKGWQYSKRGRRAAQRGGLKTSKSHNPSPSADISGLRAGPAARLAYETRGRW